MRDKKSEEKVTLNILLYFLDKYNEFSIKENEEPDFILSNDKNVIGVEIAKVFYENDNFVGINAQGLKGDIIKILSKRGLYQKMIKDSTSPEGCKYQHVKNYQVLLPPFVIAELDDQTRNVITKLFTEWLDSGMADSSMFSVFDKYHPYTEVELIYTTCSMPIMDGDDLASVNENHPLHKIIEHKNHLLQKNYKLKNPEVREWWLCLEVTTDSTISACKYSIDANYPNKFDRIFIVDPNRLRVYELEKEGN